MLVIKEPVISFTCDKCGAVNQGDLHEFTPQNTMPPSWLAECGFCHLIAVVFPGPLIARCVGSKSPNEVWDEVTKRHLLMGH